MIRSVEPLQPTKEASVANTSAGTDNSSIDTLLYRGKYLYYHSKSLFTALGMTILPKSKVLK